jgi:hypothetical protein
MFNTLKKMFKKPESTYSAINDDKKQYNISLLSFDKDDMEKLYSFFLTNMSNSETRAGMSKSERIAVSIHDVLQSKKYLLTKDEIYRYYQSKGHPDYVKTLNKLLEESIQKKQDFLQLCPKLKSGSSKLEIDRNSAASQKYNSFIESFKAYERECSKSVLEYLGGSTEDAEDALQEYEMHEKSESKVNSILKQYKTK